jgi:hypothetical protein
MAKKLLVRFVLIVGLLTGTVAAFGPVTHGGPVHTLAANGSIKTISER